MPNIVISAISGVTLYLKPSPLVSSPWGNDVVSGTWNETTSQWTFAVSGASYLVYQRVGGSPANTDIHVGDAEQAVAAAVLPGRDRGPAGRFRSVIVIAQNELITISRQVLDGNGNPMNLSGRTLQFVIQDARGNDVAIVPNADITISGTNNDTYSLAVPTNASLKSGNFSYALNQIGGGNAKLVSGDWIVEARPLADS